MSEEQKVVKQPTKKEEWVKKQQDRQNRKLEMAQRDDMDFVSRKAEDTSDFIRLIGTTDFLVNMLRKSMGRKRRIDGIKAIEFIARIEAIKDELNLWNAEASRELKRDYKPPYGFDNPLKQERNATDG